MPYNRNNKGIFKEILKFFSDLKEKLGLEDFPIMRFLLKWIFITGIAGSVFAAIIVAYYSIDLPSTSKLSEHNRTPSIKIVDESGNLVANYGETYGNWLSYEDFSPYLIQAVVATEDRRFFEHFGVDIIGLFRAAYVNFTAHRVVQGGSTITQQLAKIVFFTPERTIKRKIQEMILALWLEQKYTKKEIMAMYLNRVYLGGGNFGVDAAAHSFFGKSAKDLSIGESAILAGLLRAPSRYSPTSNPELSAQRAKQVLMNMADAGYISLEKALEVEKDLKHESPISSGNLYFAEWIAEQLPEYIGAVTTDIVVKTTLDITLEKKAEESINSVLEEKGGALNIGQAALVSMRNDGGVIAMVGGKNYKTSPFNRATQAERQPGSAFKLFVYLSAFEHGFSPDSVMVDQPIDIEGWAPENYTEKFQGEVTLTEAFAESLNSVAVQLGQEIGIDNVIDIAERLGIKSKLMAIPSAALGTNEVNLLELTGAYATVASRGFLTTPYGILEITDKDGNILYQREEEHIYTQVLEPSIVRKMNVLLTAVMNRGTGGLARLDRPSAGKTGTSQDYRDAWFIGFTPQITTGVWVGNDDNKPMKKVTGGKIPTLIWKDFMVAATENLPVEEIEMPAGGDFLRDLFPQQPPENQGERQATDLQRIPQKQKRNFWDKLFGR